MKPLPRDFLRLDVGFFSHVRIRRAAARLPDAFRTDAALVFIAVLAAHREHGQTGLLRLPHANADGFGHPLHVFGVTVARINEAVDACCAEGLLERTVDGSLKVLGWSDFWKTGRTSTERSRDSRARNATHGGVATQRGRASQRNAPHDQSSPVQSQAIPNQSLPPASPRPPTNGRDGPIAATTLEANLRQRGIRDQKRIDQCLRNLADYDQPHVVIDLAAKIAQRHGTDVPALLGHILADAQQIAVALREAVEKAQSAEAAESVRGVIAGLVQRTRP